MRDRVMTFSVRLSEYQGNVMLNMCDYDLLGSRLDEGEHVMHISEVYYGGNIVSKYEAARLLKQYSIINMAGKKTVELAVELGIGTMDAARIISNVPFMIAFKM